MNWKSIEGFEHYRVSDTGIVESKYSGSWIPLKTTFGDKYPKAALYRSSIRHDHQVHDLVLAAFVGPKPPNSEVCHWNGNHQDNRLSNLRYGNHVENAKDRSRHGSMFKPNGASNSQAKLSDKDVEQIRGLLLSKVPHRVIAEKFNVSRSCISTINSGKSWNV